jgi:NTP pyrophosphatase (non-canonical NTP hydrolase)
MYTFEGCNLVHVSKKGARTNIATCKDSEAAHFLSKAATLFSGAEDVHKLGELAVKIRQWAEDRNLVHGSNPQAQTVKLFEEGGELAGGVAKRNLPVIEDSIGDMVVVLVILAAQCGLDFTTCVANAYAEIKDRKGRMVDGVFIKESELTAATAA